MMKRPERNTMIVNQSLSHRNPLQEKMNEILNTILNLLNLSAVILNLHTVIFIAMHTV